MLICAVNGELLTLKDKKDVLLFFLLSWSNIIWSYMVHIMYLLGWAPRNLSCLEFKFDDTRLSYWHKNKIGRIELFFLLLPDFANSLPCWLSQQNWASQQGRKLAKSGSNKKNFNSANLILMSIGKSGIIIFEFQTT